jgi:cyclic pyranopterin phosphate synthase
MIDKFNRKINYLRISVTDRCHVRGVYCMPAQGIIHKEPADILSFEQIYKIVKAAVGLGIEKVRITGGEPLVRKNLPLLIRQLRAIDGLREICLTTNGIYLSEYAAALKNAGLDRINVSLDSLNSARFQEITRGGYLDTVRKGIDAALAVGLTPLKINAVLLKDFNSDEILDFASLTKIKPFNVRFIEYMPTGINYFSYDKSFFSAQTAKTICSSLGELIPIDSGQMEAAKIFRIKGFCGTLGFISPISQPFCASCNKLRLTSDGRLRNCLHSAKTIDLKKALHENKPEGTLARLIKEAIGLKPKSHNLSEQNPYAGDFSNATFGIEPENFSMCQIGG